MRVGVLGYNNGRGEVLTKLIISFLRDNTSEKEMEEIMKVSLRKSKIARISGVWYKTERVAFQSRSCLNSRPCPLRAQINLSDILKKIHTIWYTKSGNQSICMHTVVNNSVRKAYLSRSWAYSYSQVHYPWLTDISSTELKRTDKMQLINLNATLLRLFILNASKSLEKWLHHFKCSCSLRSVI